MEVSELTEYFPAMHSVHEVEDAPLYEPEEHETQADASSAEVEESKYLPAGHGEQAADDVPLNEPVGHGVQSDSSS
ncbi:hypothetical protein TrLO_g12470 [Triparma laevis f. longispina]|uniref:Uncharacterized protein n=1 Tax=Triparma laevis f. longispina TaxID=1714387 RepID=A0A9W7AA16_9STRA|nr:hypothetical protein TrLO_g12470 [Triparma laevis f. longispina]